MKNYKLSSFVITALIPLFLVVSCDYLDVLPTEQVTADDTMKDENATVGFLHSTYIGVRQSAPFGYNRAEASTDEFVNPPLWSELGQRVAWNRLSANSTTGYWTDCYDYIGHVHLFLRQIGRTNPLGVTEKQKEEWIAEAEFVKAYYHFRLLEHYGPIPVMSEYPDQNIATSDMPGRSHFDYVVDYVVDLLDRVEPLLPAVRKESEWGLGTVAASKAIKGRMLLYAASDLWNGKFPYPEWKNTNYETPGYGYELVSTKYDESKWQRALAANLEALNFAEKEGERALLSLTESRALATMQRVPLPYVPGVDPNTDEGKEFLERVLLMRYILNTYETEGNRETIWGGFDNDGENTHAAWPIRIIQRNNNWEHGFGAMAPCLYSIEHFYTRRGKLPEKDPVFISKDKWLESAGTTRSEIINLNVDREPRFYANFSFDGDDYSSLMISGDPLRLDMKSSSAQGWSPTVYNRDYSVTGYMTKKYTQPNINFGSSSGDNRINYPLPYFRLAELYLNVAECYAALGERENALRYLNPIRVRAGIPALTLSDLTNDMTIMDWVRNERFIELWGEGHRYYDLRRWMTAPQQMKAGVREGLNVEQKTDPTFEEFNRRVSITSQTFQWDNRMYISPIAVREIYSNPQLVQAPGY